MAFLDDIAARYVAAGIGTLATDLFLGSRPIIPAGIGPFTSLAETGGMSPISRHDQIAGYRQHGAQSVTRASTYQVARAKAQAAWDALVTQRNVTLGGGFYLWIMMTQEPFDMGVDDQNRSKIAFNFIAMRRAA